MAELEGLQADKENALVYKTKKKSGSSSGKVYMYLRVVYTVH